MACKNFGNNTCNQQVSSWQLNYEVVICSISAERAFSVPALRTPNTHFTHDNNPSTINNSPTKLTIEHRYLVCYAFLTGLCHKTNEPFPTSAKRLFFWSFCRLLFFISNNFIKISQVLNLLDILYTGTKWTRSLYADKILKVANFHGVQFVALKIFHGLAFQCGVYKATRVKPIHRSISSYTLCVE